MRNLEQISANLLFSVSNFSRNPPIRFAASHLSPSGTRNKLVELTLARRHEWLFLIHDSSSPEPHKGRAASHSWFMDRNDGVCDSCGICGSVTMSPWQPNITKSYGVGVGLSCIKPSSIALSKQCLRSPVSSRVTMAQSRHTFWNSSSSKKPLRFAS